MNKPEPPNNAPKKHARIGTVPFQKVKLHRLWNKTHHFTKSLVALDRSSVIYHTVLMFNIDLKIFTRKLCERPNSDRKVTNERPVNES